jgi:monofunctional biosynthetic peptidoglycan transglycosylase
MTNWFKQKLRLWYRELPRNENDQISWFRYFRNLIFKAALWFFGLTIGFTLLYKVLPVPATPLMFSRIFQQMADDKRQVRWEKDWVSIDDISPNLQLAVVCSEDQEFLEHEGFDFNAIKKAYKYNQTHKRKRGASTISQQTAKNVFLWENRSWIRKGLEVYFTFLIETIWSKEDIMEAYLNVIEFGDGIYGAEAAAMHYYGKHAKDLNQPEAAMLAGVLPSPLKLNPSAPTPDLREKQRWIMRQMRMWGGVLDFEDPNTPKKDKK